MKRPGPLEAALIAVALLLPPMAPSHAATVKPSTASRGYPALEALERDLAQLAAETRPSVVGIVARSRVEVLLQGLGEDVRLDTKRRIEEKLARRIGSGVVLDAQGHVVTMASVIEGATDVEVFPAAGESLRAVIAGIDEDSGVAVLTVENAGSLRPVRLGDAAMLREGSVITTPGNPESPGSAYTVGFLAGRGVSEGPLRRGPYLKLDAYTPPGSAGGPVFDTGGKLVGVLFGGAAPQGMKRQEVITWEVRPRGGAARAPGHPPVPPPPDVPPPPPPPAVSDLDILRSLHPPGAAAGSISYAIPADVVRWVSERLIAEGSVRRGWMGLTIETPEEGAGARQVTVSRVVEDSPAGRAGIAVGDRILKVDGVPVESAEEVVGSLAMRGPGDKVTLALARGNRDVTLTLGERPQSQPRRMPRPRPAPRLSRAPSAAMGVVLGDRDEELLRKEGAPEGMGLIVWKVLPDSRAQEAGLQEGDVLLSIDGSPVQSVGDVRRLLRLNGNVLKVIRDRKTLVMTLPPLPRMAEPPEPEPSDPD